MAEIDGLEEFIGYLEKLGKNTQGALKEALEDTATEVVATAKSVSKVKTGALRRSWTHGEVKNESDKLSVEVGSALEYAEAVELGHKTRSGSLVPAHPMLKQGIEDADLKKNIKKKLKECGW